MVALIVSAKRATVMKANITKPSQFAQPIGRNLRTPTSVAAGA